VFDYLRAPFRGALATAVCALALTGCMPPQPRTAPFRARPDSVDAGDLRGPFTGRVLDAASGSPVAGAMVYATWSLDDGYGSAQPAGYREYVTSTDASGRYKVPAFAKVRAPNGSETPEDARITDFYLVIYKRGFVGYRSDRRFDDLGPRMDFAQKQNKVQLERWRQEYSHARHLRYLGGGATLAALTAWEVDEAAAELSGGGAHTRIASDLFPQRGSRRIVAAQLVGEDDIKQVTKYDGSFEAGPLGDEPDTDVYSSQHFKALGRPQSFDLAVRMWQLEPAEAEGRYAALADSLPDVDERNEIATRSLRAKENNIFGVAFIDRERGTVVLLTCGDSQCKDAEAAVKLAHIMYDRIERTVPKRSATELAPANKAPATAAPPAEATPPAKPAAEATPPAKPAAEATPPAKAEPPKATPPGKAAAPAKAAPAKAAPAETKTAPGKTGDDAQ